MRQVLCVPAALVASMLLVSKAEAQWNVARFSATPNRFYTAVGFDPAMVTTVGYSRTVPFLGRRIQLSGDAGVGAAGLELSDFRVRVQAHGSIVHWRSLHFTGSVTFITRGTENSIYRGLNFGSDFTGTVGIYRPRWFAAAEVGFDKAVITHITHTDWYRQHIFPDAKDGWYLNAGGTFHYGVISGITLGRFELAGRFGGQQTEGFRELSSPLYVSLGVGFGF